MLFSPFKFYYYVIKNSPKKYDLAMNAHSAIGVAIFPGALMLLSFILSPFIIPVEFFAFNFVWIPVILGNTILLIKIKEQGYELKAKEEEKRRQAEREERNRIFREQMRQDAKERLKREKEWKEYWRTWESEFKKMQNNKNFSDRNMRNAMKLLGLSEGFTTKDARAAYRRLARIHHPDAGGTEENFKRLNKAYQYINNS